MSYDELHSRQAVRTAARAAETFIRHVSGNSVRAIIMRGNHVIDERTLPDYGEVLITTHDGKVRFVQTSTKEKVE